MAATTLKKVGDDIRARLKAAERSGYLPGRAPGDDYGWVRYDVRISNSKDGPKVNITINGYDWLIPDLDDRAVMAHWRDTEGKALLAKVDEVAARERWASPDGTVKVGGETKFGIIIKVTRTSVRHVTNVPEVVAHCSRCDAEILRGQARHSIVGGNGIEEFCADCHEAEMAKLLSSERVAAHGGDSLF